jgi:hypothetical protein
MFGIGKAKLLKRFPGAKDKIDEKFREEYRLSEDATNAIYEIVNTKDETNDLYLKTPIETANGRAKRLETGEDLKDEFNTNKQVKYVENMMANENHYKHISIKVLEQ